MNIRGKILVVAGIVVVILFNLIIYFAFNSLEKEISRNNDMRTSVEVLTNFRNNVVEMAHMHKLWVSTNDDYYKNEFEKKINGIYSELELLEENGELLTKDKKELTESIKEYEDLAYQFNLEGDDKLVSNEMEKKFLEANKIQLEILYNSSDAVLRVNEAIEDNNDTIIETNSNHKNILQIIGGLITFIFSIPLYIIRRLNMNGIKTDGKMLELLTPNLEEDKANCKNKIQKEKIEKTKDYYNMLSYTEAIYEEAIRQEERIQYLNENLLRIKIKISYLKDQIENLNLEEEGHLVEKYIDDIEEEFQKVMSIFQSLPNYNKIIINIIKEKNK